MMKKTLLSSFIVLLAVAVASGQEVEYKYKFGIAEFMRTPDVNSKAEEIFPLFNKSYDTLYFVRSHDFENVGNNKDNQDIWLSYKEGSGWSKGVNARDLNNSHNNSIVGVGNITNSLYLINSYTSTVIRDQGISTTTIKNKKWTRPRPIDLAVDTHHHVYSFFMNETEDVIVITMYNNLSEGEEDLFVSLKSEDGRWRDPIYLGHDVNSEGFETSPFLYKDKKTLFYSSNGFGGQGGGDIFMTKRLDDTWIHWSEPVNLGPNVNSPKFDGYFSLYENGKYLLSSNRNATYADIFEGTWEVEEVIVEKKEDVVVKEVIKEESLIEKMPANVKIRFDFNSFKFNEEKYKDEMEKTVNFLNTHPNVGVVIEGHTDKVGDEIYNLVLSHKRARGVADYLKAKLKSTDDKKVLVMPNGEANATADEAESRVVVVKYVLLGN